MATSANSNNSLDNALASTSAYRRIIHAWNHSLRFRLLWLGLMPLLLAFPIVLISLGVSGSAQLSQLIQSQLNSNLSGAQNYLRVVQSELQLRIADLVQSERITNLIQQKTPRKEIDQALSATLRGSGFDFLLIVDRNGTILGSSSGVAAGERVPDSYVIKQAQIGVASSGFEQFSFGQIFAFSPVRTKQLILRNADSTAKITLLNAAAHFPLSVTEQDAVLMGGLFINQNTALIEHMREIIYPAGKLPNQSEGFVGIFVDGKSVINSRLKTLGSFSAVLNNQSSLERDLTSSANTFGTQKLGDINFGLAISPILDGDEKTIAALAVGFPLSPYTNTAWLLLAIVSAMLGLIMLIISLIYLNAGRGIVAEIKNIINAITNFGQGNRLARINNIQRRDELGSLARQVNQLLDTITRQEKEQVVAQQEISNEASRRRAIFNSVTDGVIILNEDGSIIEANPRILMMLGYSEHEFKHLRIYDWDTRFSSKNLTKTMKESLRKGSIFESLHKRKDGTTYTAEISTSRATWAGDHFILMLIRDISLRKEQEEKLKISASVFTAAIEAIVLTDPEGIITDVNDAYTKIIGFQKEEVVGKNSGAVGFSEDDSKLFDHILTHLKSAGHWAGEIELKRKGGGLIPVQLKVSAVRSDNGSIQHFVAMFSDISQQKNQQLRLEQLALHDTLTQLPNRQKLSERLALAMATSQRNMLYGALLMLDLDNFKSLNDTHGHATGDQLLIDVAHRLTACVREVDTVARMGGDEFVILLEDLSDDPEIAKQNARQIAEKIKASIARPYQIKHGHANEIDSGLLHTCTVSIGISLFIGKELNQTQLLNRADAAMYDSKAAGRNDIRFYAEKLNPF